MFGMRDTQSPAASRGEAAWLLVYGVASFFYRISISFSIILLVASKYFFAGVLLAIWGLGNMIVRPILASAWFLAESPVLAGHRQRAVGATVAALTMVAVFLFLVPAPQWTRAEGVVWVPEQSQVRASAGCWVREVLAKSGERVEKGKALIVCEDPELATSVRVLEAQLLELRARDTAYFVGSRLNFDIVREEIVTTEAKLTEARRKLDGLQMQSPATGVFIMEGVADAPGRFAKRGELLAYVLEDGAATVRAVVEQDDVDLVRGATRSVAVRVADRIPEVYAATVQREVPGGTDRLPSAALAVTGGGEFGIDPRGIASDPDGVERPRILVPVFQFDLAVDPAVRLGALGMRVYVRFQHTPAPVGVQAYRAARRLLLRRFEV
jgi:putative peptide zinc metalloprotease protein